MMTHSIPNKKEQTLDGHGMPHVRTPVLGQTHVCTQPLRVSLVSMATLLIRKCSGGYDQGKAEVVQFSPVG